ncbi:MAG: hypothetical protein WAN16_11050, partial [Chthoniobacterales bacterium]
NQKRTCSTSSSRIRFNTARLAATDDVARSRLFTIRALDACALGLAISSPPEIEKAPDGDPVRGHVASRRPRHSTHAQADAPL